MEKPPVTIQVNQSVSPQMVLLSQLALHIMMVTDLLVGMYVFIKMSITFGRR